ncbi:hypothetical protein [Enterococcus gallinarum]|nr:hypothetical protein [Enterococcus gallinarum]
MKALLDPPTKATCNNETASYFHENHSIKKKQKRHQTSVSNAFA